MSDTTPDTAMDTSDTNTDITNGDSEPSMEDILASIRQIIADDQTDDIVNFDDLEDEPVADLNIVNENVSDVAVPITTSNGIALDVVQDTLSDVPLAIGDEDSDILELINFVDESLGSQDEAAPADMVKPDVESLGEFEDLVVGSDSIDAKAEPSVQAFSDELENKPTPVDLPAKAIVFDESLDLVMDADASDYVTTSFDAPKFSEAESVASEDIVLEDDDLVIPDVSGQAQSVKTFVEPEQVDTDVSVAGSFDKNTSDEDVTVFETAVEEKLDIVEAIVKNVPDHTTEENASLEDMDLVFVEPDDVNFPDIFKDNVVETKTSTVDETSAVDGQAPEPQSENVETVEEFEAVEVRASETPEAPEVTPEITDAVESADENVMRVSPDEDMDLVKSLLADLMDEPEDGNAESVAEVELVKPAPDFMDAAFLVDEDEAKAVFGDTEHAETQSANTQDADAQPIKTQSSDSDITEIQGSILDDVLEKSIEDEVALHAEMISTDLETDAVSVDRDLELADIDEDDSLSAIVAEAEKLSAERLQESASDASDISEDVVVLEGDYIADKLSLTTKSAAGIAAIGVGAVAFLNANTDEGVAEVPEGVVEDGANDDVGDDDMDLTSPDQIVDDQQNKPFNTSEETEIMAQASKTNTLVDEGTHKGSSDAFASLSSAVKEKAEMDERGPAVGELVQEALRPMLKEWLDKNLKGIVERAVTKEVKRISSGK